MKEETEIKVRQWILIVILTALSLGVIYLSLFVIDIFLNVFVERISRNWDVLAFAGAIIGGIISGIFTYGGVMLSIRKDEKDRFLDSYDIKKTALEDAILEIKQNFVNIQHLSPYPRIVALSNGLPLMSDIINRLKDRVGGSNIRVARMLLDMYSRINVHKEKVPLYGSQKEIADKHMDHVLRILMSLEHLDKKLDEKFDKIMNKR